MRKLICVILLAIAGGVFSMSAEEISSVETSGNWVYLYNAKGSTYCTLSASSVGNVKGYSSTFFVSENGSWIYLYNSDGKKKSTRSAL